MSRTAVARKTATHDAVVRARITAKERDEAAKVLAEMGLSVSDAIRMLLKRVAAEHALPFEVRVPNATTAAAIAELEAGKGRKFNSVADMMADLDDEDD